MKKKFVAIGIAIFILTLSVLLPNIVLAASSNANLKNLGFTPNDFTGFRASKTEYEVTVPEEVTDIEVYAEAQDENATIMGAGNYELSEGINKILVSVTAEDGTKKEYTINITKPASKAPGIVEAEQENNEALQEQEKENMIENNVTNSEVVQETKNTLSAQQRMYLVIGLVLVISLIAILCAISAYRNRYIEDDDYEEYDYEEALNRFKPLPQKEENPLEEIYHKKEKKIEKEEEERKKEENIEEHQTEIETMKIDKQVESYSKRDEMIDEIMHATEKEPKERKRGKGKHF